MADRSVTVRLQALVAPYVAGMGKATAATTGFAKATQTSMATANTQTTKLGTTAGTMPGRFNAMGMAAGIAGTAVVGGIAMAVKKFMEFDVAMDAVGAATGATGAELEQLGDTALEAAADTKFGAVDAAGGIEALGKAGISTADIIGGALAGSLDLAAAGAIEVEEAAELAAGAMTQFGLSGRDVPHIADLMAAAAGKAQGSVDDMAMAFKQGGQVASMMGLSIEETSGTLAAFASNALIGSDAGTSLRTMLLRMANPTGEARDLMEDLGIAAYDAQGNFVGMSGLAGELRSSLSGLTQEQRNAALATIFGSDAIRSATVLYNEGAEGISDWTAKVDDSGFAAEQAAKRTDNLAGDLERLGGTLEAVAIKSGGAFNDFLRGAVQELDKMVQDTDTALTEEAEIWRRNAAVWDLLAVPSIKNAEAAFGEFTNRIAEAHDPLRTAEADVARLTAAGEYYAEQTDDATGATADLTDELIELKTAAFEASQQFLTGRDHVRDWYAAVDAASVALEENGASMDVATEAGRDNEAALDAMALAALGVIEDMTAAGENTDTISRQMRQTLINTGVRFGLTEAKAEDYADSVLTIPKAVTTTPTFADTEASRKVRAFKELLAGIDKTVGVRVNVTGGLGGLGGFLTSGSTRAGGMPWLGSYPRTQGPHDGGAIDYGMPVGTPLRATFPGYFDATNLGDRSYGMYYTLRGGGKYELLAHMSRFARSDGFVSTGTLLGWSGNSGNSTGPHAHLLRNFHTGGWTGGGPINTLRGEYVVNAGSAAQWGPVLEAINAGRVGNDGGPMRLHRNDIAALGQVIAAEITTAIGAGAYSAANRANMYSRTGN